MNLVFDMDDTLVETYKIMSAVLTKLGVDVTHGQYFTPDNTDGKIHILLESPDLYMVNPVIAEGAVETLSWLQHDRGHTLSICTHRGFHKEGRKLTQDFVERELGSEGIEFNNMFVLDPAKYPCKFGFLDAVYGSGNYIIIDDRPNFTNEYTVTPNMILRDKPWNRHIDAPRFSSFKDLPTLLSYFED